MSAVDAAPFALSATVGGSRRGWMLLRLRGLRTMRARSHPFIME